MKKLSDEELAEIERGLRDRLGKLNIEPKRNPTEDDFWTSVLLGVFLALMALAATYFIYKGTLS